MTSKYDADFYPADAFLKLPERSLNVDSHTSDIDNEPATGGRFASIKTLRKEEAMLRATRRRVVRVGLVGTIFAVGFLCGSVSQRRADAQLGELGKEAMEKAGGSGGALGSAAQLGTAIVEMQQHVDGLQKNIDVLKKVKSSLGG
jgi:hypothetical protein